MGWYTHTCFSARSCKTGVSCSWSSQQSPPPPPHTHTTPHPKKTSKIPEIPKLITCVVDLIGNVARWNPQRHTGIPLSPSLIGSYGNVTQEQAKLRSLKTTPFLSHTEAAKQTGAHKNTCTVFFVFCYVWYVGLAAAVQWKVLFSLQLSGETVIRHRLWNSWQPSLPVQLTWFKYN